MGLNASARRRWVGGAALSVALVMLVGGETVLKGQLAGPRFVVYWLVCLGWTGVAVAVAFLDVRTLRRRIRQEQRDLFEETVKRIVTDAENEPHRRGRGQSRETGKPGDRRA